MTIIRKDATITSTGEDDDFPGTFEVVLSAPTLDRDGETLLAEDWKQPLPDHITFDQDHTMTVAGTVGSGAPRIDPDSGNLIVSGTYSSLARAQDVRTLVKEGHIRTTSVAFMTEKQPVKDGKHRIVRELLNGAFVAIPSNREAVVLSSKAGARNNKTDAETIQSIHDQSAALGADCSGMKDARRLARMADVKTVAGSLEAVQDRARDAIQDANPGVWTYLRATLPDGNGGGFLIFGVEDPETFDTDLFRQSYTDDGAVITLTGDPAPVDLAEVVKPDPDEDAADSGADGPPAAGAEKSAPAAGGRAAPVEDADSGAVTAKSLEEQALQIQAAQFIALL